MIKKCIKCGEEKRFYDFYPHRQQKLGVSSLCKECSKMYERMRYYKKHNFRLGFG